MTYPRVLLLLASLVAICSVLVSATDYEMNADIPLYANKIGPYHNPSEQYEYFTIPICEPKEEERKWHNLGEAIGGDRLVKTRACAAASLHDVFFHFYFRLQDPIQEGNAEAASL
jgi:hypothetical protein